MIDSITFLYRPPPEVKSFFEKEYSENPHTSNPRTTNPHTPKLSTYKSDITNFKSIPGSFEHLTAFSSTLFGNPFA